MRPRRWLRNARGPSCRRCPPTGYESFTWVGGQGRDGRVHALRSGIGEQALFSLTRPPSDRYGERVGEPGPVHPESLTASARGNRAPLDRYQRHRRRQAVRAHRGRSPARPRLRQPRSPHRHRGVAPPCRVRAAPPRVSIGSRRRQRQRHLRQQPHAIRDVLLQPGDHIQIGQTDAGLQRRPRRRGRRPPATWPTASA